MIIDDLKYGWRQLIKAPGFAVTAILTLGLAIGANTAVFSLVDAVLLKPLPYPEPDRLGTMSAIYTRNGAVVGQGSVAVTGAGWQAIQSQARSVDAAVYSGLSARVSLVAVTRAMTVAPQRVSAGFFRVLGVPPAIGREFGADEDVAGGPAIAVLSDRLWRSVFNGDAAVVGRTILLKGEPHTVLGVMPASFKTSVDADLWTPVRPSTQGEGSGNNYGVIVRLHDGVGWSQAAAEVSGAADSAIARRTSASGVTMTHGLMPLQEQMTRDVRLPLLLLSVAVGVVLLIGCVNLAGLQLARASRRTREIATRLALGGNRRTVVRQLLTESLMLSVIGGVAGVALGRIAVGLLNESAGDLLLTPWGSVELDARVLTVAIALMVLTTALFGLVPAIHATRLDVQAALAEGGTRSIAGGGRGWSRRLLVMTEVALGVVLLVAAGLLIRTFVNLQTVAPGFDPRNLIAASASLEDARYDDHARIARLFDDSLARLRRAPGVEAAAVSLGLPYERILNMGARIVGPGGRPGDFMFSTLTYVSPGYFETLRLPVRRGRSFTERDTPAAPFAVIVNDAFARRYFKDQDPIGQQIEIANTVREIVGVADNVQQRGGFMSFGPIDALPATYVPFSQFAVRGLRVYHGWFSPAWIVRATSPGTAEQEIRAAMAAVDPQLPLAAVRPIDTVRSAALGRQRMLMTLVGLLGAAALLLAAIGIHGLIATSVAERTRELGIRLALGATIPRTIRDAAVPGIVMAIAGLIIGCGVAIGVSSLLRNLLWGVKENDPMTFVAVIGVLLAVAVAASIVPALRVRKLDPMALLRSE